MYVSIDLSSKEKEKNYRRHHDMQIIADRGGEIVQRYRKSGAIVLVNSVWESDARLQDNDDKNSSLPVAGKVRIFWESHKILQYLHLTFVYSTIQ